MKARNPILIALATLAVLTLSSSIASQDGTAHSARPPPQNQNPKKHWILAKFSNSPWTGKNGPTLRRFAQSYTRR
jgi:hypothetical protein